MTAPRAFTDAEIADLLDHRPPREGEPPLTGMVTVREAVTTTVGRASMCWENVGAAGVFDSDQACVVADELVTWLERLGIPGDTLVVDRATVLVEARGPGVSAARTAAADQERFAEQRRSGVR